MFGLCTGQRLGDIATLTWQNIREDGLVDFSQGKTGRDMVLPLAKPLADYVRDELPAGDDPKAPLFPHAHHVGTQIRTCVREGWSGVREDLLCLGLTFIETFDHSVKPRLTVAFPLGVLLGVVVYQALILFYQP